MKKLSCFKAYDIRGQLGSELDEEIAYRIGRAFGEFLKAKKVVVGGDMRETSATLKQAVSNGLKDAGVNVIDIGMVGTEEIYFATKYLGVDGGVEVTASHNPIDYNGMKLVREDSKPISGDSGLKEIQRLAEENNFAAVDVAQRGTSEEASILEAYVTHLLGYVQADQLKPMKLVVNAGNGAAGHVIDEIEKRFIAASVPIEFIKVHHQADGSFPNGIPNPLLIENRPATADAVKEHGADLGIAWDGDFDRCFLFDQNGAFIEGYYIVGLLADAFLATNPGAKVIYDPRLTWNTIDIVESAGGTAIMSKTGHAFIKERMRLEDAVYGGEMSAHHYFRDFAYCDSGMIPWLLVIGLLSAKNKQLSELVAERIEAFPSSGEINNRLADPDASIKRVLAAFEKDAIHIDKTDGIGMEFDQWRFNLRRSNTEPVVRLNVESKANVALMEEKTAQILKIMLD